ncbi:MAG: hypothetical protein FWE21_01185 [Defluviitaleaceae bacterium]|nr:hypothetical protein [Defluviitaleaceae bacterium]
MDRIEIMIEARQNAEQERKIAQIAKIKYRLPAIGVYVVEVGKNQLNQIKTMDGVSQIRTGITLSTQVTQM